ncbi:MAG: tetratricopeptide repeat protein [Woeseiaceae bacterium]|nr:tetratricopeptide repeat protein [Woeseiaceae bacterium]
MHHCLGRLPARLAAPALILLSLVTATALADDAEPTDASAHLLQAEIANERQDYARAVREYRLAAEKSKSVEIASRATRVASSYGFSEDALVAAERWLDLDPGSDEALFHVARLKLRTGDIRGARRSYKALIERSDGDQDRALLSLIGVITEEDAQAADEVMRWLARPYKESGYAHYAVAVTALQADDVEHARERVQLAMEYAPDWNKPKLLYGRILLLDGETDEAIDYVARIIGDDPQPDPEARMELALIMMAAGRDDDALSQVNQIQYETGNNVDALRLMAIINFRQENLDAAWEDFQDLLASGRHTMDALYYMARIADFREETDQAMELYDEVRTGTHAVAAQRRSAAIRAFNVEDEDGALEHLDQFASDNPNHAIDMVQAKAQLLAALERYPEALEEYDRMIEFRPESENVLLGRAELLLRMERIEDAVAQYRVAVKRFPESSLSLNALGYTLADRTEEFKEAEKLIRKALKYDPENPAIIDSLGWVLYKLGNNEQALVELERAYERLEDPEVAAHIVEVLAALDRHDEALAFLESAEEKTPENELLEDVRERVFPSAD